MNLYLALQFIGWGIYSAATYVFIAQFTQPQHGAWLNALCIGISGFASSHLLRLWLKARPRSFSSLFASVGYYFALLVAATAFWLTLVLVVLSMVMPQFKLASVNAFVLAYYFGIYFIVLLTWLLLYIGYHSHLKGKQHEIERLKLQVALQEAQLQGLKFQMNPHFLFNALNSIRTLALVSPQQTRDMVSQLSMMLRYTLTCGDRSWVSLAEELELVRHYLAIEQVRFEQRLKVNWQIADEALQYAVLPMSLQTLVENAIKHGIATLPQGGCIDIRANIGQQRLQLVVENPGRLPDNHNDNVGLSNTKELLALKFGDKATLSLQQQQDRVVATICMPMTEVEDEIESTDR